MASRPMSGPTPIARLSSRRLPSHPPISTMAKPVLMRYPTNPGEVFADSAYRGDHCGNAVRGERRNTARCRHRNVGTGRSGRCEHVLRLGTNRSIAFVAGSRRSSVHGNEATACVRMAMARACKKAGRYQTRLAAIACDSETELKAVVGNGPVACNNDTGAVQPETAEATSRQRGR